MQILGGHFGVTAAELDPERCSAPLHLRQTFPTAPLVLRIPIGADPLILRLVHRAGELGVRGVLVEGEPLEPPLRRSLTQPGDLGWEAIGWLTAVRRVALSPVMASVLRMVFAEAAHQSRVSGLLRRRGEAASTVRGRFPREGLPSLREWH